MSWGRSRYAGEEMSNQECRWKHCKRKTPMGPRGPLLYCDDSCARAWVQHKRSPEPKLHGAVKLITDNLKAMETLLGKAEFSPEGRAFVLRQLDQLRKRVEAHEPADHGAQGASQTHREARRATTPPGA